MKWKYYQKCNKKEKKRWGRDTEDKNEKIWRVGTTCFLVLQVWRCLVTPTRHRMENRESSSCICRVLVFLKLLQLFSLCWTSPWLRTFPTCFLRSLPKLVLSVLRRPQFLSKCLSSQDWLLGLTTWHQGSQAVMKERWAVIPSMIMHYDLCIFYWSHRPRLVQCVNMLYKDMSTRKSGSQGHLWSLSPLSCYSSGS